MSWKYFLLLLLIVLLAADITASTKSRKKDKAKARQEKEENQDESESSLLSGKKQEESKKEHGERERDREKPERKEKKESESSEEKDDDKKNSTEIVIPKNRAKRELYDILFHFPRRHNFTRGTPEYIEAENERTNQLIARYEKLARDIRKKKMQERMMQWTLRHYFGKEKLEHVTREEIIEKMPQIMADHERNNQRRLQNYKRRRLEQIRILEEDNRRAARQRFEEEKMEEMRRVNVNAHIRPHGKKQPKPDSETQKIRENRETNAASLPKSSEEVIPEEVDKDKTLVSSSKSDVN